MPTSRPRPHAAVPADPDPGAGGAEGVLPEPEGNASGRARNTIIFSIATGLSRVAGLLREMVSSSLYGGGAIASAFTLAFTIPNLLRSLFADMALSAAFVPVFTDLLERKRRREALLLMSTLFWVLLIALGALVTVAILTAPLYVPLLTSDDLRAEVGNIDHITVVLSQLMLPTVLLLGLNGLFVGALNAYDHFSVPALSPLVWNVVIIAVNVTLLSAFGEDIYAQAVGVLVGTVVQLLMVVPVLRRYGIRIVPHVDLRDPRVKQVLVLMVPVAISFGLINFSAAVDAKLGGEVSEQGPRAIEVAFRLYMLPQGVFSVAIVTVLFPVLARAVARSDFDGLRSLVSGGMAQILVLLLPVGLLFSSPVIAHDIVTVLFQRGRWTDSDTDAATIALVWLGACLALNGVSLLLSRTFFALQRPWANTGLALASLVANIAASVALYKPLGIAGIVLGTFVGNVVLVGLQIRLLRKETGGPLGLLPVVRSVLQVLVASVLAVLVATAVALIGRIATDDLGPGAAGDVVRVLYLGIAVLAGGVVYVGLARDLGLRELEPAGARFVRLWARLQGPLLRLPGVRGIVAASDRPGARAFSGAVESFLRVLAWPLRLPTTLAIALSRLLVGLVPAGPALAVAGPAPTVGRSSTPVAGDRVVGPRGGGRGAAGPTPPAQGTTGPSTGTGTTPGIEPPTTTGPGAPPVSGVPAGPGGAPAPGGAHPTRDPASGPGEPGPYDAAADWPTIGQRGGETLDVPWPGVQHEGQDPYSEPAWEDDVGPSRLEAYGIERGQGLTPAQEARAEQRAQARRMIEAREAALERIAERERRRREGGGGGRPKRGRRGRSE